MKTTIEDTGDASHPAFAEMTGLCAVMRRLTSPPPSPSQPPPSHSWSGGLENAIGPSTSTTPSTANASSLRSIIARSLEPAARPRVKGGGIASRSRPTCRLVHGGRPQPERANPECRRAHEESEWYSSYAPSGQREVVSPETRVQPSPRGDLAITLSGGGAPAAYQVGVLRGLARHFPQARPEILTGESAGAINVAYLAAHRGALPEAVEDLADLWSRLTPHQVFRVGAPALARNALRWGTRLLSGGAAIAPTVHGLLDTAPLRLLLERSLPTANGEILGIADKLERGLLNAIALTTIDYSTGRTVTWVQGRQIRDWERPLRRSAKTRLTIDHVLASTSLPFIFPAVRLGDNWYGDGGVRLHAPLSPAIHLGARRILAVSTRYQPTQEEADRPAIRGYPPPGHVAGILLDAIFLDLLDYDALVLERLNRMLEKLPRQEWGDLRPVELLVLRPSQDLARLAADCESSLPRGLRFLTRGLGTHETSRPALLSLFLFVPEFLQPLIQIGESDVEARLDEVGAFLTGAGGLSR